jgi:hypothetical protein
MTKLMIQNDSERVRMRKQIRALKRAELGASNVEFQKMWYAHRMALMAMYCE